MRALLAFTCLILSALPGVVFPRAAAASFTFVAETEPGEYAYIGDVALSPDGKFVYVTAPGAIEIVVFARNTETGALTELFDVPTAVPDVNNLAISPDGAHLYASTYQDGRVLTYGRDQTTGDLTLLQSQQVVIGAVHHLLRGQGLAMSADGDDLYATGDDDDAIVHFRRDGGSGLLTLADVQENGMEGVTGLDGPLDVVVTPDGTGVYAGSFNGTSVVAFTRDPSTGALTFAAEENDALDLVHPFSVTTSPDSQNLYVAANGGIVVYQRDPLTNALTKLQATHDQADGGIRITADGLRAAACGGHAGLFGYTRDPQIGTLVADEHYVGSNENSSAPGYCTKILMTDNGRQVFLLTSYEIAEQVYTYAVSVFRRPYAECSDAPQTGCRQTAKPGVSSLLLRHVLGGGKDTLKWKWKGAATSLAEFGDPVAHPADYTLCLYDAGGLVLAAHAPGVSPCHEEAGCWVLKPATQYRYVDKTGRRQGLNDLQLRAGDAAARLAASARGAKLGLVDAALAGVVIMQVQSSDGQRSRCWEAQYSTPTVNQPDRYSARSD